MINIYFLTNTEHSMSEVVIICPSSVIYNRNVKLCDL